MPKVTLQLLHVCCSMRVSLCPHQQFGRELKMERWMKLGKDTWRKMANGRLVRRLMATHRQQQALHPTKRQQIEGFWAEKPRWIRGIAMWPGTCGINGRTDRWGQMGTWVAVQALPLPPGSLPSERTLLHAPVRTCPHSYVCP